MQGSDRILRKNCLPIAGGNSVISSDTRVNSNIAQSMVETSEKRFSG